MNVLRDIVRLMRLCIAGPGGKAGIPLYAVVLALELVEIVVSLRMIAWTKDFYDALQQLDAAETARQVGIFGLIVGAASALVLSSGYLRKLLEIRWRRALTAQVLDLWMNGRAYLRSGAARDQDKLDNPDQRIAEDCRIFLGASATSGHISAAGLIPLTLDLITNVVGLFSYVALLWSLSTFALDLSFIGIDAELPRYMVWAAFIYVALSTGATHLLGRPLKQLYFGQQRREADFRFALVRVRQNAEAVAQSRGEAAERGELDRRFDGIALNWRRLMNRELILSLFTAPYRRTVLRIPTFLALPAFFAGNVTFGGLMQLGSAFANVATSLSWFIFSYRALAELAAATTRLANFIDSLGPDNHSGIDVRTGPHGQLRISDLALATPDGRRLLDIPALAIEQGETVWLKGASGLGKTTLIKALAGIWPHGTGTIDTPAASSIFLTQQPYFPLGTARDAVAYPDMADAFDPPAIDDALAKAGFEAERIPAMAGAAVEGLSGGERQRLALARLFLHQPQWVILDEATSALDDEAERAVLARLRAALPGCTIVIVSHREPEGLGTVRGIDLARRTASSPQARTLEQA